jgi:hypothetical protein
MARGFGTAEVGSRCLLVSFGISQHNVAKVNLQYETPSTRQIAQYGGLKPSQVV